ELAKYGTRISEKDVALVSAGVMKLNHELAAVQEENKILLRRLTKLQSMVNGPDVPTLPADLRCKVLVCDPKWNFVLIDAGEDQGMMDRAELLVARDGRLVGKARAVRVDKSRSIANLIPGWQVGEVHEGDLLIPACPGS